MIKFEGSLCQPITGYSNILLNYDKPHRISQIRRKKLASSKADAVGMEGGLYRQDYISVQTLVNHPPKQPPFQIRQTELASSKNRIFKTVQELEKEFIARYGLGGLFSDEVSYLNLYTGEVVVLPKYANFMAIVNAFRIRQNKSGIYDLGLIQKLDDYLSTHD